MPDLRGRLESVLGTKYRLVRELTGGGMSRVFLAEDLQLLREVVVKVLAPDLLDDTRIERFRQEVLQTARLQHPTIVPILEVGAITGTGAHRIPYYIMPYARGDSLRSRLHHEGALSVSVTMRVLRSVLDALAYAHAHGVVHRDIKPENIFLSGTNALVADFGIAKAIAGPGSRDGTTSPGLAVGTPMYMAPEQLVDTERVGPRADLFAVGVVAFEMLTGKLPWSSATPVEMLASQARNRFTPLRSLRPDVPAAMAAVIESCLAWDESGRPDSAAAALHALESVPVQHTPDTTETLAAATAETRVRRRRVVPPVAVLAALLLLGAGAVLVRFVTKTPAVSGYRKLAVLYPELVDQGSGRTELADRLYAMLTAALAPVSGLRLVGSISVPQMTEQGLRPDEIIDSLKREGVETILALRSTTMTSGALLLAVESHGPVGSGRETVGGPFPVSALERLSPDSLSIIVRMLAAQSVAKLRLGSANPSASETQMIDAYMVWLNGRDAMGRRTPSGLREAIRHFDRAIALDSAYAQAHADLAQAIALTLFYHYAMPEAPLELAARALRLADRAVAIQPQFADGYLARGLIGTVVGAPVPYLQRNFDEAARLLSANPYSQTWYLGLLAKQGRFEDAVQRAEDEVRLESRSPGHRVASALYALPAGQYMTTVRNATEARPLFAGVPIISQFELLARVLLGGRALAECASVPAGPYLGSRALCLEGIGRGTDGRALTDSLFAVLSGKAPRDSTFDLALPAGEMALHSARHGEHEAARQWIRQAFAESPAGIDFRIMRSGMFGPEAIALADSLQRSAWDRVRVLATAVRP